MTFHTDIVRGLRKDTWLWDGCSRIHLTPFLDDLRAGTVYQSNTVVTGAIQGVSSAPAKCGAAVIQIQQLDGTFGPHIFLEEIYFVPDYVAPPPGVPAPAGRPARRAFGRQLSIK